MVHEKPKDESATKVQEIEQTIIFDSTATTPTVHEKLSDEALSFDLPGSSSDLAPIDSKTADVKKTGQLPEQFGRYHIKQMLGEGAMGTVYLAHDTQLDRRVALKIPKFKPGSSEKFIKRFYREAQSAAVLSHPNICSVFDVGQIDQTHYIAMAFIQGHALDDYIKQGKALTQRSCAMVVRKIAIALDEAHNNGVIHRDLKPANIMINQRNEPIVMDFGLAQRETDDDEARLTQDGAILGSPAYMSPEQVAGKPDDVGVSSDIYGLGVVLYELLAGQVPFRGKGSITSIIAEILTVEAPNLVEVRADLDPKLATICEKAIAKKPEDRFASMKEFADTLTSYLKSSNEPVAAAAQASVADLEVARIREQISLVRTMCSEGQNAAAVSILEKIISSGKPDSKYVKWAQQELPRIKNIANREAAAVKLAKQPVAESHPFGLGDPLGIPANDPLGFPATDPLGTPASTSSPNMMPARPMLQRPKKLSGDNGDQIPKWMWYIIAIPIVALGIGILAMMLSSAFKSDPKPVADGKDQRNDVIDGTTPSDKESVSPTNENSDNLAGTENKVPVEKNGDVESKPASEVKPNTNDPDSSANQNPDDQKKGRPDPGPPLGLPMPVDRAFEQFDANDDGVLTDLEIPRREHKLFMEADKNNDQEVSREELEELDRAIREGEFIPAKPKFGHPDDLKQLADRIFEQHDLDGDEIIDSNEIPPLWAKILARVDMNDDGVVDRSEIEKSAEILRELREGRRERKPIIRKPNKPAKIPAPFSD